MRDRSFCLIILLFRDSNSLYIAAYRITMHGIKYGSRLNVIKCVGKSDSSLRAKLFR